MSRRRRDLLTLVIGGLLILAGLALALHPLLHPDHTPPDVWVTRGLIAVGLVLLFPSLGGRVVRWARAFRAGRQ